MSARHTRRDFLAAAQHMAAAGATASRLLAAGVTAGPARTDQAAGDAARPWYRITNAADGDAEVMLYDEIGGWYGSTADEFVAELRGITAPRMTVRINSPGGSVFEGIAIANALRNHPAQVTVQVDGIAASIASVIAMAGDRIVMMPSSTLMIHDASGVCMGNAGDMQEMADLLDLLSNNIADVYASRAGGTRDDWRAAMRAESWYLAQDAVDAGLADEVGQTSKGAAEPEMRREFDLAAFGYTNGPAAEEAKPEPSTINVQVHLDGKVIAEQLVDPLRGLIREQAAAEAEQPVEPVAEVVEEPAAVADPTPVEQLPEPEPQHDRANDDIAWADLTAHLTQTEPDDWSALVANLTAEASSSAATDA